MLGLHLIILFPLTLLMASSKYLNLKQDPPQKKRFFWSNPYNTDVMITSLIEILELPNFGHMTASTIKFESRDNILLVTS